MLKNFLYRSLLMAALIIFGTSGANAQDAYTIGYITDFSGPLRSTYVPTWEGFELYIKALNERGGIGGKKVNIVLDDDASRADRAVALAKKQVESDKVLGIFGLSNSSTLGPVHAEMRKSGVPVVTSYSGALDALPPATPFSYSTGVVFEVAGEAIGDLIRNVKPNGKIVALTIDTVGGRAAVAHNKKVSESVGYKVDEVVLPLSTTDFTPFAQAVVQQNPDIVVGHYGAGQHLGMIVALRRSGYTGPYVTASYGTSEDTIKQASLRAGSGENIYYATRYSSAFDNNPAIEQVAAAQKKYGTTLPFSSIHITGWALGKVAEAALKDCGWPCTREKLNKTFESLKVDMGGLTGGPIEFSPSDGYGPSYWRLYLWDAKSGRMEPKSGWIKKDSKGYK